MPLHLTKIAFGAKSYAHLESWYENREAIALTTRNRPTRHAECVGGSLYWIHAGTIIGRSPLLGFEENGQGRYWIRIEPRLIPVAPRAKRAHQGWRYLEEKDAPADLGGDGAGGDALPAHLAQELDRLGLM